MEGVGGVGEERNAYKNNGKNYFRLENERKNKTNNTISLYDRTRSFFYYFNVQNYKESCKSSISGRKKKWKEKKVYTWENLRLVKNVHAEYGNYNLKDFLLLSVFISAGWDFELY